MKYITVLSREEFVRHSLQLALFDYETLAREARNRADCGRLMGEAEKVPDGSPLRGSIAQAGKFS